MNEKKNIESYEKVSKRKGKRDKAATKRPETHTHTEYK